MPKSGMCKRLRPPVQFQTRRLLSVDPSAGLVEGSNSRMTEGYGGHHLLVYQSTKSRFLGDVESRGIEYDIARAYLERTGRYALDAENSAWRHPPLAMAKVLARDAIADHARSEVRADTRRGGHACGQPLTHRRH